MPLNQTINYKPKLIAMHEQGVILKSITRHDDYPLYVMVTKSKSKPDKFNGVVIHDAAAGVYAEHKKPGTILQDYPAELFIPADWSDVIDSLS